MRIFVVVAMLALLVSPAAAQHHHHPPQDADLHEKFYSTWYMPDNPAGAAATKRTAIRPKSRWSAAASTPGDGRTENTSSSPLTRSSRTGTTRTAATTSARRRRARSATRPTPCFASTRGWHMKFVIVTDRALKDGCCALCCEAIRAEYLRDLDTRLSYCDHHCYSAHLRMSVLRLQNHTRRVS